MDPTQILPNQIHKYASQDWDQTRTWTLDLDLDMHLILALDRKM